MTEENRSTDALISRRRLAEKATPGPWSVYDYCVLPTTYSDRPANVLIADCSREHDNDKQTKANASYIAANSPDVVMADIDEILRLRAKVERLEKEADWLAEQLSYSCFFTGEHNCGIPKPCPKDYGFRCLDVDAKEWREAARNAVEADNANS